jgi:hypothetical protein
MKYLLLFFALFFGLSAEAQTLRFEADTVFFTRSGVRFDHAFVALQPFEDGSLGVVLSPLKELTDWERARVQQYLNSKSAFRGHPMRWTDVPVDAVPVVWESPAASSSPVNSLESAGRSFLAVPSIGIATGLAGFVSAAGGSPSSAVFIGIAGGIAGLVTYVKGCVSLMQAGKELEAATAQQP